MIANIAEALMFLGERGYEVLKDGKRVVTKPCSEGFNPPVYCQESAVREPGLHASQNVESVPQADGCCYGYLMTNEHSTDCSVPQADGCGEETEAWRERNGF